jgi:hypothetical protein
MNDTPLLYRFTVKCDRDTNREIERLAKACNVSAQTYVQKHFEMITGDFQVPEKPPAPSVSINRIEPVKRPPPPPKTIRVKKPTPRERILAALINARRPDGLICAAQPKIADMAQFSIPTLLKYLDEMVKDGSVEIVTEGAKGRPTVYRVLTEGKA